MSPRYNYSWLCVKIIETSSTRPIILFLSITFCTAINQPKALVTSKFYHVATITNFSGTERLDA
jgi:hypothetical protein